MEKEWLGKRNPRLPHRPAWQNCLQSVFRSCTRRPLLLPWRTGLSSRLPGNRHGQSHSNGCVFEMVFAFSVLGMLVMLPALSEATTSNLTREFHDGDHSDGSSRAADTTR